jgi:hypothetical protein
MVRLYQMPLAASTASLTVFLGECRKSLLDFLKREAHVSSIMNAGRTIARCQGAGLWRKGLLCLAKSALGVAACALAAATGDAKAQTATNTVLYWLNPATTFEEGCIPPCLCPDMLPVPVTGTFLLTPITL